MLLKYKFLLGHRVEKNIVVYLWVFMLMSREVEDGCGKCSCVVFFPCPGDGCVLNPTRSSKLSVNYLFIFTSEFSQMLQLMVTTFDLVCIIDWFNTDFMTDALPSTILLFILACDQGDQCQTWGPGVLVDNPAARPGHIYTSLTTALLSEQDWDITW